MKKWTFILLTTLSFSLHAHSEQEMTFQDAVTTLACFYGSNTWRTFESDTIGKNLAGEVVSFLCNSDFSVPETPFHLEKNQKIVVCALAKHAETIKLPEEIQRACDVLSYIYSPQTKGSGSTDIQVEAQALYKLMKRGAPSSHKQKNNRLGRQEHKEMTRRQRQDRLARKQAARQKRAEKTMQKRLNDFKTKNRIQKEKIRKEEIAEAARLKMISNREQKIAAQQQAAAQEKVTAQEQKINDRLQEIHGLR